MTTLGEQRVRTGFNPSGDTDVNQIKRMTADCIDWCEERKQRHAKNALGLSEINRLLVLAQEHFEVAAMFAVKARTG